MDTNNTHVEEVIVAIDSELEFQIPSDQEGLLLWLKDCFNLPKAAVSPEVIKSFGGLREIVRSGIFVVAALHQPRHEKDLFTEDKERCRRRILRLSEVLSILSSDFVDSLSTIRFWSKDKEGKVWLMGIRSEHDGVYIFQEEPKNRLLRIGTKWVKRRKPSSKTQTH